MALFQDTRELSRQSQHVGMDKVDGWRKTALSVMGYKDTGEKNLWGKIGLMGPSSRLAAKSLSAGTETGEVLKETDDEYMSSLLSRAKLGFEVGKTAMTLGLGGAGGGALTSLAKGGGASSAVGNAVGSAVGKKTGSEVMSRATDMLASNLTEQGIEATEDAITKQTDKLTGNKTDKELLDSFGEDEDELTNSFNLKDENGDYFINEAGEKVYSDDLMKEEKKRKNTAMMNKVIGNVPLIGGVASAAMGVHASAKAENQEASKLANKFLKTKATDHKFNLL